MEDKNIYTDKQMRDWMKVLVKSIPEHQTSKQTKKELDKIYKLIEEIPKRLGCDSHNAMILRHERAIFGDKNDDTNNGMKVQIQEMHNFFIGAKGSSKFVVYFFGALGTISVGFYALKTFFKSIVQ